MRTCLCVAAALLFTGVLAVAQPASLNLSEDLGPEPRSETWSFPIRVSETHTKLFLDVNFRLTAGQVSLRVTDSTGAPLHQESTSGELKLHLPLEFPSAGVYQLEIIADQAAGHWRAWLYPLDAASAAKQILVSALGMIVVAVAAVLYWKSRSQTRWAWFWIGAAVWSAAVALKSVWTLLLYEPVLHALQRALPPPAYLLAGSIYTGLLTGVFEIGVTLAAALIWRRWAADAGRAVAIGVGAGAFEALLLALIGLVQAAALSGGLLADGYAGPIGAPALVPLMWLVGPVERLIAVLCHTSSRTLALFAVATHRWRYFWGGFAILTAIDTIAGYAVLSGVLETHSVWWIELALAPAALVSIPIIRWCIAHWPPPAAAASDASSPP